MKFRPLLLAATVAAGALTAVGGLQASALHVSSAFQAPRAPGVQFRNAFGVWIAGSGGLDSIVNGVGGPVRSDVPGSVIPVDVASYP